MKKRWNSFLIIGTVLTGILVLIILVGLFYKPFDPTEMDVLAKKQPPSGVHWMGTDNFGRDVFSRVLEGAGSSLLVSLAIVAIGFSVGTVLGAVCGYFGGVADAVLTRICDVITAFPSVLLALVAVALIGNGKNQVIGVLGVLFIPSFARVARTEFARCCQQNYIKSARLMGVSPVRIMLVHIFPNTWSVLLPTIVIGFNNAILSEASMSYLSIGVKPPDASLGLMLYDSQSYLKSTPWCALFAGLAMVLLIMGFSFLSEGLQQCSRRD